jgi:glycosyltransferase involved in cell wall biosynthesis
MLMSELKKNISVVIPVYNSAPMLPQLVFRLISVLSGLAAEFEIILVNDGSRDTSWAVIEELASQHQCVKGICMMRNYGQHNALLAGIREAKFDITITMDDDLQHPPEQLPKLLSALDAKYDVVYAPPLEEQHGLLRDLASVITKTALKSAIGAETAKHASAWRIFRTNIRDSFSQFQAPMVSLDVLLTWGTNRFGTCPLPHDARLVGSSNYTFGKLIRHAFNMMTGFSTIPLQFASIMGFGLTLFGISILIYVLVIYALHGSGVAGFPFLASIIAIFSGAQLFSLGIIGEYLARMHFRIMDKPSYSIKNRV